MQVKLIFQKNTGLRFSKHEVLFEWEHYFRDFQLFVFFLFFGNTSKIAVLLAWEFNSGELDQQFYISLRCLKMQKNICSPASFFRVLYKFGCFVGSLWVSFGHLSFL